MTSTTQYTGNRKGTSPIVAQEEKEWIQDQIHMSENEETIHEGENKDTDLSDENARE